jgi:hypothetical protein
MGLSNEQILKIANTIILELSEEIILNIFECEKFKDYPLHFGYDEAIYMELFLINMREEEKLNISNNKIYIILRNRLLQKYKSLQKKVKKIGGR